MRGATRVVHIQPTTSDQPYTPLLSAQVVPPRSCDLCIVGGSGALQLPHGLPPHAQAVSEGWLLQLAEEQEAVEVGPFLLTARGATPL